MDVRFDAACFQHRNHAGHLRVANVRHVLLERDSEHEDRPVRGLQAVSDLLDDEGPHRVVGTAAGEDDLRVVADLRRAMGQIVGIDADAVAPDQARREVQEVPLGAGGIEHVVGRGVPGEQNICETSLMKAMLMSRWAFSITLAASAVRISRAMNTLPPLIVP